MILHALVSRTRFAIYYVYGHNIDRNQFIYLFYVIREIERIILVIRKIIGT